MTFGSRSEGGREPDEEESEKVRVESGCMFDTTSVVFKFQCVEEPREKTVKPKWWDPTKRLESVDLR